MYYTKFYGTETRLAHLQDLEVLDDGGDDEVDQQK